jgi:glyoxylate carboligase
MYSNSYINTYTSYINTYTEGNKMTPAEIELAQQAMVMLLIAFVTYIMLK